MLGVQDEEHGTLLGYKINGDLKDIPNYEHFWSTIILMCLKNILVAFNKKSVVSNIKFSSEESSILPQADEQGCHNNRVQGNAHFNLNCESV